MKPSQIFRYAALVIAGLAVSPGANAAGAGLPQLDIKTWPSQLFWLIVLFTVGYILMAKFITPRIGSVLEERRAKLDDDLGKARSASEDAARIRLEYEANLDAARTAAAETAKEAAAEATRRAVASDLKIARKLAEKTSKAEAKLAKARSEAIANLNNVAAEAALAAAAQVANIQITTAKAEKIADKLATQIGKREAK